MAEQILLQVLLTKTTTLLQKQAQKTYKNVLSARDKKLLQNSCVFEILEKACLEYIKRQNNKEFNNYCGTEVTVYVSFVRILTPSGGRKHEQDKQTYYRYSPVWNELWH